MKHSARSTNTCTRTPTDEEFQAYDGPAWHRVDNDWRCPSCLRTKRQLLVWGPSKKGGLRWKCQLVQHHDHGWPERFPRTLICCTCNSLDPRIKRMVGIDGDFSFSAEEMQYCLDHNQISYNCHIPPAAVIVARARKIVEEVNESRPIVSSKRILESIARYNEDGNIEGLRRFVDVLDLRFIHPHYVYEIWRITRHIPNRSDFQNRVIALKPVWEQYRWGYMDAERWHLEDEQARQQEAERSCRQAFGYSLEPEDLKRIDQAIIDYLNRDSFKLGDSKYGRRYTVKRVTWDLQDVVKLNHETETVSDRFVTEQKRGAIQNRLHDLANRGLVIIEFSQVRLAGLSKLPEITFTD